MVLDFVQATQPKAWTHLSSILKDKLEPLFVKEGRVAGEGRTALDVDRIERARVGRRIWRLRGVMERRGVLNVGYHIWADVERLDVGLDGTPRRTRRQPEQRAESLHCT